MNGNCIEDIYDLRPLESCKNLENIQIRDNIIAEPEGIIPSESPDRELFSLLSDFYLNSEENSYSTKNDKLLFI